MTKGVKMKHKEITATGGSGIFTILLIVFVVLKLSGLVDWPWIWVLAPFWIPLGLAILYLCIVFIISLF
jgi:hypothetical protein